MADIINAETIARWREAPSDQRAAALRTLGELAKSADRNGQPGLANAARDAVMILADAGRAAAEPEAKVCEHAFAPSGADDTCVLCGESR